MSGPSPVDDALRRGRRRKKPWEQGFDNPQEIAKAIAAEAIYAARRTAIEKVRARLHLVLPYDNNKRNHARDLNADCNSLATWIVDDVLAVLRERGE